MDDTCAFGVLDGFSDGFSAEMDEGLNDGLDERRLDGRLLGFTTTTADEGLSDGLKDSRMDGRLLGFGVNFEGFNDGLEERRLDGRILGLPEGTIDGTELGDNFTFGAADGRMVVFKFLLDGFCDRFNIVDGFEDGLGESRTSCMGILVGF
jgi:hypothetical protein